MREGPAVDHSDDLLREMQQWHMKPHAITCLDVIRVCDSVESWRGALEMLSYCFEWRLRGALEL